MTYQRLWGNRRKYDIRVGFIERIEVGLEKVWLVHVAPVLEIVNLLHKPSQTHVRKYQLNKLRMQFQQNSRLDRLSMLNWKFFC